jgi:MOSC domain-containing protein YiiM
LDNAVLAYDAGHYPAWKEKLGAELPPGAFGENFTVAGFTDDGVCVGDVWEVGDAGLRLQVTQARMPCYKLARRLRQAHIVKMVHETGWGGWYLRVLAEGPAAPGMEIRRTARVHPEWTVAKAVKVMYSHKKQPEAAAALAALPELSTRWREQLQSAD